MNEKYESFIKKINSMINKNEANIFFENSFCKIKQKIVNEKKQINQNNYFLKLDKYDMLNVHTYEFKDNHFNDDNIKKLCWWCSQIIENFICLPDKLINCVKTNELI